MAGKNILIVEDAHDLGRLLQSALATVSADLKIHVVSSAEEALHAPPRRRYALAVVDVRLPGLNGLDLIARLRARQKDLKTIAITGVLDAGYSQQAEALQVDAFLTKPFEMSIFLDTVKRLLDLKTEPPERYGPPEGNLPELHLPGVIADLRQECAADAVVLLDESGRVAARAGNSQPEALEAEGGPAVLASLSAAKNVWRLVGYGALRGGQIFTGEKMDLVVMPVGEFALVLGFTVGRSLLKLASALESAMAKRDSLVAVLTQMGAPVQVLAPVLPPETLSALNEEIPLAAEAAAESAPSVEPDGTAEHLSDLLNHPTEKLKSQAVDEFWQNASKNTGTGPLNPDALTYDQARQLGLAPEESGNHESG
jgi:CheY-like chemotaxis protein